MRRQLLMPSSGIGDTVLGLCVCAGIKQKYPNDELAYGCKNQEWVKPFEGYDCLISEFGDRHGGQQLRPYNSYGKEQQERGKKSRVEYYAEVVPGVTPVMPPLREPLPKHELAGAVVLAPWSRWANRNWSVPHWLALEGLLMERGERVVLLDDDDGKAEAVPWQSHPTQQPPEVRQPGARPASPAVNPGWRRPGGPATGSKRRWDAFKGERFIGQPPYEVLRLIASARAVIANDSGMIHVAGLLGTPAVALCGPTWGKSVFGFYPSVRWVDGSLPCNGCYWQNVISNECRTVCASLQTITPKQVLAVLYR